VVVVVVDANDLNARPDAWVLFQSSITVVIYPVLHDAIPYREREPDYHLLREPERVAHRHVRDLERLSYTVTLTPKGAA
jgi:hypothetical protein